MSHRTPPDQLNEIYPNLYLGDLTAAESPHILEAYAITHIISLTTHRPKIPPSLQITKKHFRIRDNTTSNILGVLPECISRLEYILGDEDGGVDELGRRRRVLVHCRMGMSRSGGAVVAYVMKFAGCPAGVALDYVRQMRPIVHPNRAFMAQLELWGACAYDTSFLEDHGKYVLPEAAEVDMDVDVGEGAAGGVEADVEGGEAGEEEEVDEETLLMRALEMSLASEESTAGVWASEVTENVQNAETVIDVEMEETFMDALTEIPLYTPIPPPAPASAPPVLTTQVDTAVSGILTSTNEDTRMADPSSLMTPLPPSPHDKAEEDTVRMQLEERRKQIEEKLHDVGITKVEKGKGKEEPAEVKEEWGMVVMRDGMKRCFEECLKDVEEELAVRVA